MSQLFYKEAYVNRLTRRNKVGRTMWSIVYVLLFRLSPRACYGWRRSLLKLFGAKMDNTALVFPDVQIWAPWNLEMGARSVMGEKVNCYNVGLICFEEDTSAAGFNVLCTASHDIHSEGRELVVEPIRIRRGAWLFFNSFIGPGVEIGEAGIVAASAAVFKNVEPYSVVGGNPARHLKWRDLQKRTTKN